MEQNSFGDPGPLRPDPRLDETIASEAGGAGLTRLGALEATIGPIPRVDLLAAEPGGDRLLGATGDGLVADGTTRYRIDGEIARGGMGSVLKGRDPDIGRDIALKVLREDYRGDAGMIRRFVEEAQIGGQLQHPGIVPIYEMGVFDDQRPFFAMKLIQGETLAERLAGRADPGDDLPRLVGIFEAIAQAVAYAHARGVIHRDLKPANIMLGSFGEVQVMDWGLAKVLSLAAAAPPPATSPAAGPPPEAAIETARGLSGCPELSLAGSVLGTPLYMAPEQARGEIERVEKRADVFSLGSILCEILTGQPAFAGRTTVEVLRKAAAGDLDDARARLDACAAGADLVALARDCLAPEPADRPGDAGAVATRVALHLAGVQDRLRRAEIQTVEERARRRLTTVSAAALLLLSLAAAGGYAWNLQQRALRLTRTTRVVDAALADASSRRAEAQAGSGDDEAARWAEARSAIRRAEGLLAQGEADAPLRSRVADLGAAIDRDAAAADDRSRRRRVDRQLLDRLDEAQAARVEHNSPQRFDADYAAAFRAAGLDLDAMPPAEAGRRLVTSVDPVELATHLDQWASSRRRSGRPEADWRRLVAAARAADPNPWRDRLRARTGDTSPAAIEEFRRLADDPTGLAAQPATSLILLARQLRAGIGDAPRADRILRMAVVRHPADFWARQELAATSYIRGEQAGEPGPRSGEAVRQFTAAMAIRPGSCTAHIRVAMALQQDGRFDEALDEFREAVRLKPDFADAHISLGVALQQQGKLDEAVAEYREALRLNPAAPIAHANLGGALRLQGQPEAALAEFREAVKLGPDFADAHAGFAVALQQQGKLDEADAEYREALRLKPGSAEARANHAFLLNSRGRTDEAVTEYREAVKLKPNSPAIHAALGVALDRLGQLDEAVAELRAALRLQPENLGVTNYLADVLANHPDPARRDPAAAVELARRAIAAAPHERLFRNTLGQAEFRAGHLDEAREVLAQSMQMSGGGDANDWYFMAMIHGRQGQPEEARRWLDRANAWAEAHGPAEASFKQYRAEVEAMLATGSPSPPPGGR